MRNPEVRYQTLREGAELASKDLGIQPRRRAPTEVERERLSGTSGRDSGAGSGATRVSLSASQVRLAENLFPSLPKEQAHQRWWKEIGSKIQNKGQ